MKSFNQTVTDLQTEINNDDSTMKTYLQMKVNQSIHKVLAMRDWNFNRATKTIDTVEDQQAYLSPYNVLKMDWVTVKISTTIYKPTEVKTTEAWKILNRNVVGGDIPQFWYFNPDTKKIELFPIPSTKDNTIRMGFTKKVRDLGVTDYTAGTVTTVANSAAIVGDSTTFLASMIGRHLQITDTDSILGDFWFEISAFADATHITVKEAAPVVVSGKNYTIAELIPFPDGHEDIPYFWTAWQYYKKKEKFKATAADFKEDYLDAVAEMLRRDSKTANDLVVQSTQQPVDPNFDPWSITITT